MLICRWWWSCLNVGAVSQHIQLTLVWVNLTAYDSLLCLVIRELRGGRAATNIRLCRERNMSRYYSKVASSLPLIVVVNCMEMFFFAEIVLLWWLALRLKETLQHTISLHLSSVTTCFECMNWNAWIEMKFNFTNFYSSTKERKFVMWQESNSWGFHFLHQKTTVLIYLTKGVYFDVWSTILPDVPKTKAWMWK